MIFKCIGGVKHNQEIDIPAHQARKFIQVDSNIDVKDLFSVDYAEDLKQYVLKTEVYRKMTFTYKFHDGSIRLWEVYVIDSDYRDVQNDIDIAIYKFIDSLLGKGR